jgi:molybdopterin converting factor small subunit
MAASCPIISPFVPRSPGPRPMSVTVYVPSLLRAYCNGASRLTVSSSTVRQALAELERTYPALYRGVCDETDAVRRHVNLFVNSSHIRDLQGLETALVPGDELTILPSVSGG